MEDSTDIVPANVPMARPIREVVIPLANNVTNSSRKTTMGGRF